MEHHRPWLGWDARLLVIGQPEPAVTESVDNSVYLRARPGTLDLIGVEIVGVRVLLREHPEARPVLLDLLQTAWAHFRPTDEPEAERRPRLTQELQQRGALAIAAT